MKSLVKNIPLEWDLWIGQFRAFFPSNEEDRKACLKVMGSAESIAAFELPSDNGIQSEEEDATLLAACQDTSNGKIIAAMRLADALPLKNQVPTKESFYIEHFDEDRLADMVVFTHLAISSAYLKTPAPQVLISHCFIEILKAGGQATLMACDPGHFSMYKRLGMRPIGKLQKSEDDRFFIPMIFLPDQDYLSIIHSPVLRLLRGMYFDEYQSICDWYYQLVRENSELQIGSAFYPDDEKDFEGHHSITEGLSQKGQEIFLKNAMVRSYREGEELIANNDGGKAFGYIRKGMVKVMIGSKTVVILGEGDIFGEIAYILRTKRSAQVVAASPDTEVVLFSEEALSRLEDDSDKMVIWKNLAKVLAQRVVLTNKLLG